MLKLTTIAVCLLFATAASAQVQLRDRNGKYLGNLNANQFDPNSVANPYGRYGNPYSPDSINNPYGRYGNPFSPDSATNPYATGGNPGGMPKLFD